jgi:tRNA pseudouridine55 synthase
LAVTRYAYPELVLEIECSGGTYVRSLGRDLAESLGTAAVMSALVRSAIGPWEVADAIDPRNLTAADWSGHLEPLREAVSGMPACTLSETDLARVRRGLSISVAGAADGDEIAAIDGSGRLVAILVPRGPSQWGPTKNLE